MPPRGKTVAAKGSKEIIVDRPTDRLTDQPTATGRSLKVSLKLTM